MSKKEFSETLHRLLSDLSWADVVSSVEFYEEMIADRMEEGLSEEDAVAQVGNPEEIAARIRAELPSAAEVKTEPGRKTSLFWFFLIAASPVWIPLLIVFLAVEISLLAVVFSFIVSLWSFVVAFGGASLAGFVAAAVSALQNNLLSAGMLCGMGLFCAGLAILSFFLCRFVTKKVFGWTKSGVEKGLAWIRERSWKK